MVKVGITFLSDSLQIELGDSGVKAEITMHVGTTHM